MLAVALVNAAIGFISVLSFNFLRVPESDAAIYFWLFSVAVVFIIANLKLCKKRILMWLFGLTVYILAHWVFVYQLSLSGYNVSISESTSNYPTIQPGDVVLSRTRPSYQRGAFVGYDVTASRVDRKRILAVPGDTVEVCGNRVSVNGYDVQIEEGTAVFERPLACEHDATAYELTRDEYFLVGDSENSLDSRTLGPVEKEAIRFYSVLLIRGDDTVSLEPDESFSALER